MSRHPENHLLNPAFKWIPSDYTDIRETFKRARDENTRAYGPQRNTKPERDCTSAGSNREDGSQG